MANDLLKVGAILGGLVLLDQFFQGGGNGNLPFFGGGGIMGGLLGGDLGGNASLLASEDNDPTTDEDIGVMPTSEGPNLNSGAPVAVTSSGTLLSYTPRSIAIQSEVTALVRSGGAGTYEITGELTRNLEDVIIGAAEVSPGSVVKPGQYQPSSGTFKNSRLIVPTRTKSSNGSNNTKSVSASQPTKESIPGNQRPSNYGGYV